MKTNRIITLAVLPFLFTLVSCDQGHKEIAQLQGQLEAHKEETSRLYQVNDSLIDVIFALEGRMEQIENDVEAPAEVSEEDKPIRELITNLHQGWETLASWKDKNDLLKYFLAEYTTNQVRINTENIPLVQRHNDRNFEEHLDAIAGVEGLSVKFSQPQFFYTEVKGDVFTTCFRALVRIYQHNELKRTNSVVCLVSGENKDGWKVGNYSWVSLNY